jgi:glycerophosphoryl diester phosphodiesterase
VDNKLQHPLLKIAHRGGGGLWPQNTMCAFRGAVSLGVDMLELDLHLSRDGRLVVMHDPTVEATTGGEGALRDLTLVQIRSLDAGYSWTDDGGCTFPFRGHGINVPILEEVLTAFPEMRLSIDIKPEEPDIIAPLARLLEEHNALSRVWVGSFHDIQLRRFRRRCPSVPRIAGVRETRLFHTFTRLRLSRLYRPPIQAFSVPEHSGSRQVITPRFIRAAHAQGIQVNVWTIDEPADMKRLISWEVDGIITDYPDRLLALVR